VHGVSMGNAEWQNKSLVYGILYSVPRASLQGLLEARAESIVI
jgi:hypothetical protein